MWPHHDLFDNATITFLQTGHKFTVIEIGHKSTRGARKMGTSTLASRLLLKLGARRLASLPGAQRKRAQVDLQVDFDINWPQVYFY